MLRLFRKTCWLWCVLLIFSGCTRGRYLNRADRESHRILAQKTARRPWEPTPDFTIQPDPRSRFFDPTCPTDPELPIPSPKLYDYTLPDLPPRDPARFRLGAKSIESIEPLEPIEGVPDELRPEGSTRRDIFDDLLQLAAYQPTESDDTQPDPFNTENGIESLKLVAIPKEVWSSLPASCLTRMLEFRTVREEFQRSLQRAPRPDERSDSRRLALEDIVDLTLINSRQYQTQKEVLYQAALSLSLERYAYQMKFSVGGGTSAANFTHNRDAGATVNDLGIPTTFAGDKLLATGGDLLARFANSVVLTFNGPEGFAADIGSDLLLEISQSVFQRDVVLEQLTQAERDVVYAARDFARFRKTLFRDLAASYYNLLLTYRRIEIDAQDYFSNLRAFNQGQAEYRAGRLPRVQVDQVEQEALQSRSRLIASCNTLERGLDGLKMTIGLPPELPLDLDLTELEILTLRDEVTVAGEMVRRARRNLLTERGRRAPDSVVLLNSAVDLTRKLLTLMQMLQRLGPEQPEIEGLKILLARQVADEARELVRFNREILAKDKREQPPKPPERILWRTMDLVDSLLALARRKEELARRLKISEPDRQRLVSRLDALQTRFKQLRVGLEKATTGQQQVAQLLVAADALLADAILVARDARTLTKDPQRTAEQELQETLRQVDRLLAKSQELLASESGGLVPIQIDMDDAMLTGLVQRFDLMNQRGALADSWRLIKLAGDDLKSILNLNAAQLIRTRFDANQPFGFTFDDSQTRLALTLDTPLNRKAQRNAFRQSLINYQAALRALIQAEDDTKLAIRNDLRQLRLDRDQYQIAVASAALAYERVVSTRLQLNLGVQDISTRDFLESQQAYTASLNAVAGQHIGYVVNRIQLFFDMESLEVDQQGFWPELYNERYQPTPYHQLPPHARPAYGKLHPHLWYSPQIKRMLHVPTGKSEIYRQERLSQSKPPLAEQESAEKQ